MPKVEKKVLEPPLPMKVDDDMTSEKLVIDEMIAEMPESEMTESKEDNVGKLADTSRQNTQLERDRQINVLSLASSIWHKRKGHGMVGNQRPWALVQVKVDSVVGQPVKPMWSPRSVGVQTNR
uniref:Uncharacterized protein n=1 Tax=Romanomermis culicivorax TaxID=13658 RepID=A0A915K8K1_ROMCU